MQKMNNKKYSLLIALGVMVLLSASSCSKPAADLIVGNWKLVHCNYEYYDEYYDEYYYDNGDPSLEGKVWEFCSDGFLSCFFYGHYYYEYPYYYNYDYHYYTTSCEGSYSVHGPEIYFDYTTIDGISTASCGGRITEMGDNTMTICLQNYYGNSELPFSTIYLYFVRTDEEPSQEGSVSTELTFDLHDSFGDGWNGASLIVGYPNGEEETMTIEAGSYKSYSHSVYLGDVIWLEWNHGGDDQECSFEVRNEYGNVIFQYSGGFNNRLEFSVIP